MELQMKINCEEKIKKIAQQEIIKKTKCLMLQLSKNNENMMAQNFHSSINFQADLFDFWLAIEVLPDPFISGIPWSFFCNLINA